eukprot:367593_1
MAEAWVLHTERKWMKYTLQILDPKYYRRLNDVLLSNHGKIQINFLLEHWGQLKDVHGRVYQPPIDLDKCKEQYEEWKTLYVVDLAAMFEGLKPYDRCLGFYRLSALQYGEEYDQWMKLWRCLLLDWNASMKMERVFRIRKLMQSEECGSYGCVNKRCMCFVYANMDVLV